MISKPGTFVNLLRFEPDIFIEKLAEPLFGHIRLPRGYLVRDDYRTFGVVARRRRCQISDLDRLVRFVLRMRGVPTSLLAYLFDQDPSTIKRDVRHIGELIFEKLQGIYLNSISIGTAEYLQKIGTGAFRHFPTALYAGDVVKCQKRRPDNIGHTLYYDGYKRMYTFGYFCLVDSEGICRSINGPYPGSVNDFEAYHGSDLHQSRGNYLGPADKVLVDGIYARIQQGNSPFIVPYCYMNRQLTVAEERFNFIHRWDRSIVEHFFGRLKLYYPILTQFPFTDDYISVYFTSCVILCNILLKYQNPLRK